LENKQMPPNPDAPLSIPEIQTYGFNAVRQKYTGMPLEQGHGALPEKEQAKLHCRAIEAAEGKEVANAIRRKLGFPIAEEVAAAKAEAERVHAEKLKAAYAALAEKEAAEAAAKAEATIKDEKAQEVPGPLLSTAVH
jgi:hypothetical protein